MKRERNRTIELNGQNKNPLSTTAKNTKHTSTSTVTNQIATKAAALL